MPPSDALTDLRPDRAAIQAWLEAPDSRQLPVLASSNQGIILRWPDQDGAWVLKLAHGRGPIRWLREASLKREHAAYRRLAGLAGFPACAGMVGRRVLVLAHVQGTALRDAHVQQPEAFFDRFLDRIRAMHERGVAHSDLKRKSNLMVTAAGEPVILDLGAAFLRREKGFHPFNQWLFGFLAQTDLNAWIKHKYGGYENVAGADQGILNRSFLERWLEKLRRLR